MKRRNCLLILWRENQILIWQWQTLLWSFSNYWSWSRNQLVLYLSENQSVSGWAGWSSVTGKSDYGDSRSKSTVDYIVPVHKPIIENATVQQHIRLWQQVSKEVNQEVTIITFALAVAMQWYSIAWQSQEEFRNVLVRIWVFHTICSHLEILGKMMTGLGFEDIVTETRICASGSGYTKAIFISKSSALKGNVGIDSSM